MEKKKELLRWDSNPQHTAYEADALPTELLRHSAESPSTERERERERETDSFLLYTF